MRENRRYILSCLFITILSGFIHFSVGQTMAMNISASNVQAMAVYGESSNFGIGLLNTPGGIQYNITVPADISTLLSAIEFSTVRDCNAMGARTSAYVYIRYKDGTTETYDLFGAWRHFSKAGLRGICFFVSPAGQSLFENYAQ